MHTPPESDNKSLVKASFHVFMEQEPQTFPDMQMTQPPKYPLKVEDHVPRERNDRYYFELAVSRKENGLDTSSTSRKDKLECKMKSLEKEEREASFCSSDIAGFQRSRFSKQGT
ncbi:hypothetical protein PGT21_022322 [Puccinia graminis f. sp. tritici]|uniref:Uncharacterized protein n=1 Tax=Puccinia graminis f. sp. tritici TaxID=56615 RepID=A0A5B0LRB0_PUCGR|nr:hypothetical protein PGT21_022322 [Puccinia graminis f. sp. tritici]